MKNKWLTFDSSFIMLSNYMKSMSCNGEFSFPCWFPLPVFLPLGAGSLWGNPWHCRCQMSANGVIDTNKMAVIHKPAFCSLCNFTFDIQVAFNLDNKHTHLLPASLTLHLLSLIITWLVLYKSIQGLVAVVLTLLL